MVSLETIRASNLETRNLENLVAVFGKLRRPCSLHGPLFGQFATY
jgi:hypothetical protein